MKTINEQLYELYASKWGDLSKAMPVSVANDEKTLAHPLLLHVDEEAWNNANLKVMLFGQETNTWGGVPDPLAPIEALLDLYDQFFHNGQCWRHGGNFWNANNRFENMLDDAYPEKKICYLWNNIVKIGLDDEKGRPPLDMYNKIERALFRVVPQEVSILKPDVILLFSGPDYDDAILNSFGDVAYTPIPSFSQRQLVRIALPDVALTLRTYHPGFLWRDGIDCYFDAILKEIALLHGHGLPRS